tara:strand:+ start:95 stop:307 length:213 start_codon:yes stop_codon:yes gene_type:complete
MPDVKTFYPGATVSNTINNSTDAAIAVVGNTVDDQNQANNAKVWTGTAAQYQALVTAGTVDADTLYFTIL